jgi:uncharacterized delta-60 repeat protein
MPDGGVAFSGLVQTAVLSQMIVGRLTGEGTPAAFGPDGRGTVEIDFGTFGALAWDTEAQADGKIVVVGRTDTHTGSTWLYDYALARLNPDGTLDDTFGTGGKMVTGFPSAEFEQLTKVAITSDGKIFASGIHQIYGTAGERKASVLRYTSSGQLDTTFGGTGRVLVNLSTTDVVTEIVPLADGSVLLAGYSERNVAPYDDAFLLRLLPNGSADPAFGTGGAVRFDVNNDYNSISAVAVDSGGGIYALGVLPGSTSTTTTLQLRRYTSSGALDPDFGAGGIATHSNLSNIFTATDMKLSVGGKLLVFGATRNTVRDVYLMAFNRSDGSMDSTFGSGGRRQYDFQGSDIGAEFHVAPDGKWLLTGQAQGTGTFNDFAAARVIGDQLPPPPWLSASEGAEYTFDDNGLNVTSGTVTFTADAASTHPALDVTVATAGEVTFATGQHLASLTIAGGSARLVSGGDKLLVVTSVSLSGDARLDLTDNHLLIDYTGDSPYADINGYAVSGRNTGVGIVSATSPDGDLVLAVADNVHLGAMTFGDISIDDTTIVCRYTYYGDANMDGQVTTDDYVAVDLNLGRSNPQWLHGDVDMNGEVTTDDYVVIDLNLGKGAAVPVTIVDVEAVFIEKSKTAGGRRTGQAGFRRR